MRQRHHHQNVGQGAEAEGRYLYATEAAIGQLMAQPRQGKNRRGAVAVRGIQGDARAPAEVHLDEWPGDSNVEPRRHEPHRQRSS